jgi:hypothetical protein
MKFMCRRYHPPGEREEYPDAMNDEFDYDLTPDQWDMLRNLRNTASRPPRINRFTIEGLIKIGLVTVHGDMPVLSVDGRKVLVRGSSRLLLDLAA